MSKIPQKTKREFAEHRKTDQYKSFVKRMKDMLNEMNKKNDDTKTKKDASVDSNENTTKSSDLPQTNNSERTISAMPIAQDTTTNVIKSPDIAVAPALASVSDQVINNNAKVVDTTPIGQMVTKNQATSIVKSPDIVVIPASASDQVIKNNAKVVDTTPPVSQKSNSDVTKILNVSTAHVDKATDTHDFSTNTNTHTDNSYDLSAVGLL